MSVNKSEIIKKLSDNYPNFLKKDLTKLVEIILIEIKNSLKRKERVELRDIFTLEIKHQKAYFGRNPKTNEKIFIREKYGVNFRSSKFWLKRINEEK